MIEVGQYRLIFPLKSPPTAALALMIGLVMMQSKHPVLGPRTASLPASKVSLERDRKVLRIKPQNTAPLCCLVCMPCQPVVGWEQVTDRKHCTWASCVPGPAHVHFRVVLTSAEALQGSSCWSREY